MNALSSLDLPYRELCIGFSVSVYAFETYLDVRQRRNLKAKKVPPELSEIVSEEKFKKAQAYGLDKNGFGFITSAFHEAVTVAELWFYFLPWLWALSLTIISKFGFGNEYQILQSCVFVVVYGFISLVVDLPFSLYSTFVIEERHGFNKQTLKLYFLDMAKTLVLSLVIGLPVLAAILYIIQWGGQYFFLYVWAFVTIFSLGMTFIYPTVIAPLFNKFTPLPDGSLRSEIETLAKQVGFPLTKLYVIDGSKRSAHSNAYFYGFFKNKRIVLYDTLLNHFKDDTDGNNHIVAILAHELGHFKLNHTWKNMTIAITNTFVTFFLFGLMINNDNMYRSFGFPVSPRPILMGLLCFMKVLEPVNHVLALSMNFLSRHFEYQADAFATKLGFSLEKPLCVLQIENLSEMNPDGLYSAYHYSHPTLLERIRAIRTLSKKSS